MAAAWMWIAGQLGAMSRFPERGAMLSLHKIRELSLETAPGRKTKTNRAAVIGVCGHSRQFPIQFGFCCQSLFQQRIAFISHSILQQEIVRQSPTQSPLSLTTIHLHNSPLPRPLVLTFQEPLLGDGLLAGPTDDCELVNHPIGFNSQADEGCISPSGLEKRFGPHVCKQAPAPRIVPQEPHSSLGGCPEDPRGVPTAPQPFF